MRPVHRNLPAAVLFCFVVGCADEASTEGEAPASVSASDDPVEAALPGPSIAEPGGGAGSSAPDVPSAGTPGVPGPEAAHAPPSGSPAPSNGPLPSTPMPVASETSAPPTVAEPMSTGPTSDGGSSGSGGTSVGGDPPFGGSTGVLATAGVGSEGVAGAGGGGGSGGGDSAEPAVHFVGRFLDAAADGMRFEWSGSGVVAAFEGDTVGVTLDDGGSNQFTVLIDGEQKPKLVALAGSNRYELAAGLAAGLHRVELYRRTEASFGATSFQGFDFGSAGSLLAPPAPPARRLEIIGDSISCGYGNEGTSATCGFSADTENHYETYGAIAARALDAEVVTIAWSGKGIVYNYDTDTNEPMPALYDRILPTEAGNNWDFSVIPDAVVINLGTNDFSTEGDPTAELFAARYLELLTHLREVYPTAFILCTVGPLLSGADLDAARAGIDEAVEMRAAAGDADVEAWEMNIQNDNPGCDYHPSLATHQAMAEALVTELSARLGW